MSTERKTLDELGAQAKAIDADEEAQRAATDVARDIQLHVAELVATGNVEHLERLRERIGFASLDRALSIARTRRRG